MAFPQSAAAMATATVLALASANAPYGAPGAVAAAPCVRGETESRGRSAVDDGEIRYTETTKFDDLRTHAITAWNAFRKVDITPDGATTVNDLEFRDYSRNTATAAYYERHGGTAQTDYIFLNKYQIDGYYRNEPSMRRNIVVHELGHALGLCHKSDRVSSALRTGVSTTQYPTVVDKANYLKLWG
ncbi:hypothetical protein [Streptomyces sp. NPDC050504]|uniref:hypothetical protein n=1 Tax=Streptomyces sp. NPDC050504 TaxID=3365618 RepID=UPI0037A81885